jgi:hypothetical protein
MSNSSKNINNNDFMDIILKSCFEHQLQIKMLHFQTSGYSIHKATDAYLNKFEERFDKLMEVMQGIFKKLETPHINISFNTLKDDNIVEAIDKFIETMRTMDNIYKKYTELLNIRDEIVGDAQQLKYLLTFK